MIFGTDDLLSVLDGRRFYEKRRWYIWGSLMRAPINLEEAEATFGIEQILNPKQRKNKERHHKSVGMAREHCYHCEKWGYRTEEAARTIIGRMLHNGSLSGPDMYTFRPYLCAHGWWHTGHDSNSRRLLDAKLKTLQPTPAPCFAAA